MNTKSPIVNKSKKIVYKKGIFSTKTLTSENECKLLISEYERLLQLDQNNEINFSLLYNTFLNLCIKKEFNLIDTLFSLVKKHIESHLKVTDLKSDSCVEMFISKIKICEIIIEKTKYPLVNNISRFDKEAIMKINNFNPKTLILEFLKTSTILSNIKQFIISKEINYSEKTTLNILQLIKNIGAKDTFNEIVEFNLNKIINIYEESIKNENLELIAEYIDKYNDKINYDTFQFKLLFGEGNSNKLREKLISVAFLNQIPKILSNHEILKQTFETRNFHSIKLIYKILSRNNELIKSFRENFFDFCLNRFLNEIIPPTNINEGLKYLNNLIDYVITLQTIFTDALNKDRRIELKYKETLSRIINNNKVKNVGVLCGIHINEIILKSDYEGIKKKFNEFTLITNIINDVESFYAAYHKYVVKRISNFKFDYNIEKYLINNLKYNFGGKNNFYLVRLLEDKKKSDNLFKNFLKSYPENCEVNLFSYNGLNKYDLEYVCKFENYFDSIVTSLNIEYNNIYKNCISRKITVSQTLSNCMVIFKTNSEKYELYLNFIQASILFLFKYEKEKLSFEEIMKFLEVKNTPVFKKMLLLLINSGVLIKESKCQELVSTDLIRVNLNYNSNHKVINLNKFENILSSNKTENDLKQLENSIESNTNLYLNNKNMIIDAKIIKILKGINSIEQNALIKVILAQTKEMFPPDISTVHRRMELLIEREFIIRELVEEKYINLKYKA